MPTTQEIHDYQEQLTAYRRQLADYLMQQAFYGTAASPQAVLDGIRKTRADIDRVKNILQRWGITTDSDDTAPPQS